MQFGKAVIAIGPVESILFANIEGVIGAGIFRVLLTTEGISWRREGQGPRVPREGISKVALEEDGLGMRALVEPAHLQ